jgi:hypothetical protein
VLSDAGWALAVPDPQDPVTHIWAESADVAGSDALAAAIEERVRAVEG